MIKTILFDIDDTLYSYTNANKTAIKNVYRYCREEFGWEDAKTDAALSEAQKEIVASLGRSAAAIHNRLIRFQRMLEKEGRPLFPHAVSLYHTYWDSLIENMRAEPGTGELFDRAKDAGCRIGIATDMTAYIQFKKLEALKLLDKVDFIVTSEETGAEKPSPVFFAVCLEKARCAREECLMVGDNWEKDIKGALGAGMRAAWYHPQEGEASAEQEALRIRSFAEIAEFLEHTSA